MSDAEEQLERFERELSHALRRVNAPGTLVESVVARVAAEPRRVRVFPQWRVWIGSVAASLVLVGLLLGSVEHHRAAARARADRDFALSLQITDRALEQTRQHLQRAGIALDE